MSASPASPHSFKNYRPLFMLVLVSALVATAFNCSLNGGHRVWMHGFMGFFFCVFSLLKLFDPEGFANGFQKYDLLAKRTRAYAYIYPYIELALGLGYFSFAVPSLVYVATIIVMLFGGLGVLIALKHGLKMDCPCMGNILKVPLSTVTLTEDMVMALMAVLLLA